MKLSKNFALRNAGKLFYRIRVVDKMIFELTEQFNNEARDKCTYILGKITALNENRDSPHTEIVKKCVSTKREINESYDFIDEYDFLWGYLKGLEIILNIDRGKFEVPINFVFFIYSEDQDVLDKYQMALELSDCFFHYDQTEETIRYYVSNDVYNISKKISLLNPYTEYIVCVVYTFDRKPNIETLQKLSLYKYESVFLHKENTEENVNKILINLLKKTSV